MRFKANLKIFIGIIVIVLIAAVSSELTRRCFNRRDIVNAHIELSLDSLKEIRPNRIMRENYDDESYKVIAYFDSTKCSACQLKRIPMWSSIIEKIDKSQILVNFFFVFSPPVGEESLFEKEIMSSRILYPVYIDSQRVFRQQNSALLEGRSHICILVNKDGKILFSGNPTSNIYQEERFLMFINNLGKKSDQ